MRIQLTTTEEQMDGYFWASPKNKKFSGDFNNLSGYCRNAQCLEIYGPDILDYIEPSKINEVLGHYSNLLRSGSKITVGGTDPYLLSKELCNRHINGAEYNYIIYGRPGVCGLHPIPAIKQILQNAQIKINDISVIYKDAMYCIEGTKL